MTSCCYLSCLAPEPFWTIDEKERFWKILEEYVRRLVTGEFPLPSVSLDCHKKRRCGKGGSYELCKSLIREYMWSGRYSLAVSTFKALNKLSKSPTNDTDSELMKMKTIFMEKPFRGSHHYGQSSSMIRIQSAYGPSNPKVPFTNLLCVCFGGANTYKDTATAQVPRKMNLCFKQYHTLIHGDSSQLTEAGVANSCTATKGGWEQIVLGHLNPRCNLTIILLYSDFPLVLLLNMLMRAQMLLPLQDDEVTPALCQTPNICCDSYCYVLVFINLILGRPLTLLLSTLPFKTLCLGCFCSFKRSKFSTPYLVLPSTLGSPPVELFALCPAHGIRGLLVTMMFCRPNGLDDPIWTFSLTNIQSDESRHISVTLQSQQGVEIARDSHIERRSHREEIAWRRGRMEMKNRCTQCLQIDLQMMIKGKCMDFHLKKFDAVQNLSNGILEERHLKNHELQNPSNVSAHQTKLKAYSLLVTKTYQKLLKMVTSSDKFKS